MRREGLAKFYDRLTPEERFRLLIEALVRGDEGEWRNLEKSCPKRIYEMSDVAYWHRVEASEEITLTVCLDLAPRLAKLKMLMAFNEALPLLQNICIDEAHIAYFRGYVAGLKRIQRSANPEDDSQDLESPEIEHGLSEITSNLAEGWREFTHILEASQQDVLKEVMGMWEAFSSFSRAELGIKSEKLIKVWLEPMWPEIENLESVSDHPVANEERVEEYASLLRRLWRELTT